MARVDVPGVAPVAAGEPARPGLLTTARNRTSEWSGWEGGIQFTEPCAQVRSWPGCGASGDEEKEFAQDRHLVEVDPVTLYVPLVCDWELEPEDLDAEARAQLEAGSDVALASVLLTGDSNHGGAGNPNLQDAAVPLGDDSVTPGAAVARLLAARAACSTRTTLHASLDVLVYLVARGLATRVGDTYETVGGALLIADAGYGDGGAPTQDSPPVTEPGDGQAYLYATGPVEYALGPATNQVVDGAERLNRYYTLAERPAIVRFDPCCVFAQLVDVPDECCNVVGGET